MAPGSARAPAAVTSTGALASRAAAIPQRFAMDPPLTSTPRDSAG